MTYLLQYALMRGSKSNGKVSVQDFEESAFAAFAESSLGGFSAFSAFSAPPEASLAVFASVPFSALALASIDSPFPDFSPFADLAALADLTLNTFAAEGYQGRWVETQLYSMK